MKLNDDQKEIEESVLHAVDTNNHDSNNCIYIDGPGRS